MIYLNVQQELFQKQETQYKEFMQKSIPNEPNLIGVRMGYLKQTANRLIKNGLWQEYISHQAFYHEEKIIQALIMASQIKSKQEMTLFESFVPHITNWAICDCFCTYIKINPEEKEFFFKVIQKYLKSDKEFEVRVALVMLLMHYINSNYLDRIFKILDEFSHQGYYAQMAAAWLLSLCYVKHKDKTKDYLLRSKLDNDTFNKGIQKMIESNLVSKDEYPFLKALKRR